MSDQQIPLNQDELNRLQERVQELATPEQVIEDNPSYDNFVDWCEIDIGLSSDRRISIFQHAEKEFRNAGFPQHADIIKIVHKKFVNSN